MAVVPLVSVVIPCYNGAHYLADAIRSVREQGIPETEILIADDASTDDSIAVAVALAREDPRIRVIRREVNGGPGATRNTGLRGATGRYVCFLDADDEYVPGFFAAALPVLHSDSTVAGVVTGMELVNAHRPVHPVQLEAMIRSHPSNLIVRRAAVDWIGGFAEEPAFRGKVAGEDIAFRQALARHFRLARIDRPLLRYRVQRGSHFDRFLDRSRVVDGKLVFSRLPDDDPPRVFANAMKLYRNRVDDRIGVVAAIGGSPDGNRPLLSHTLRSVMEYQYWQRKTATVEGFLRPEEGYALFLWARDGPGRGAVVEIGSLFGRSTSWLAAGTRKTRREKVVAVDHFQGSSEHRPEGTHPVALVDHSTRTVFQANLERLGLKEWVEILAGLSVEVGAGWSGPIRLLFIDGDHSYPACRADFETWSRHVIPNGIVAFHDVGVWPGVTQFYAELIEQERTWREVGRVHSLRLVQRRSV